MKTKRQRIKTGRPMVCPCCGESYLTESETAAIVALFSSSEPMTAVELATITGRNERTMRRSLGANPDWFRKESYRRPNKARTYLVVMYNLTGEGLKIAQRITG